jgi:undecaprenyl-diphosphatase
MRDAGLTLNVMLHAGTLAATALVLRRRLAAAVADGVRALRRPSRFAETAGGRDAAFVLLASLPTAVVGLALRDAVERWTESPVVVGMGLVATSVLLLSMRWTESGDCEFPAPGVALLIGIAQGLAVVPGISRSGSTICVALWLGVRKDRAFELSMLASVPAVLGAVVLEARHAVLTPTGATAAGIGAVVSFGVGVAALLALRRAINRGRLYWFALWTLPLAGLALAVGAG